MQRTAGGTGTLHKMIIHPNKITRDMNMDMISDMLHMTVRVVLLAYTPKL